MKIKTISIYIVLSLVLWALVLKSGVHATIAGVLAALTIPLEKNKNNEKSPLIVIEKALHPWVAYIILPIFAFANAGVPLKEISFENWMDPLSLGIMLGLFFGKQLGICIGTWLPIKLRLAKLPTATNWWQLYRVSILCGIGFTMSLFIGTLAFEEGGPQYDHL